MENSPWARGFVAPTTPNTEALRQAEMRRDQRGESNQGSIHGRPPCDCPNHLPLRVRVDIQRSFPPNPPGRLEAKMSVRASNERVGVRSLNTVLNGGPALVGVFHGSWMLCRVDVQMSLPPTEPALVDPKNITRPSFRMVTAASLTAGSFSSATKTTGPCASPSRVTEA